jgi:hypothetical protein
MRESHARGKKRLALLTLQFACGNDKAPAPECPDTWAAAEIPAPVYLNGNLQGQVSQFHI